jgi:hypothetical protein
MRMTPLRIGQGLLATFAVLATLAVLTPLADAASGGASGGVGMKGQFGLAVAAGNQGTASYFQLSVAPGHSATAAVAVSNLGNKTETLAIGRVVGITAANGGSAYRLASWGCAGPGCWVTGLPHLVTLPAHASEVLNFKVRVPFWTVPGQYLAGISAQLAARPRAAEVGFNSGAVVVDAVTIGVAVTVGDLPAMTTRLRIAGVWGATVGQLARLNIRLVNTGQTFTRAAGTASCAAGGQSRFYPVLADTILPHDNALITVNAPGLSAGATVPCAIRLRYGSGHVTRWVGLVTIPGPATARFVHTSNGVYTQLSQSGIPAWGVGLISIGSLLLVGISILLYRQHRFH